MLIHGPVLFAFNGRKPALGEAGLSKGLKRGWLGTLAPQTTCTAISKETRRELMRLPKLAPNPNQAFVSDLG
jgi:hypothetical protein